MMSYNDLPAPNAIVMNREQNPPIASQEGEQTSAIPSEQPAANTEVD